MNSGLSCSALPAALVQHDAYRPPDWRWQRAQSWSTRTDRRGWQDEDFWTREAAIALRPRPWWFRPSRALAERFQRVEAAQQIHQGAFADVALHNACILAEMSIHDIAARLHQPVDAVQWYERLFFDVRHRLECETAIVLSVLGQQPPAGKRRVAWTLQWLAYYGGPVVLEAAAPQMCSQLRGVDVESVRIPAAVSDLIDTLLDDQQWPFSAELWAAVSPWLRSAPLTTPLLGNWSTTMSAQLAAALSQPEAPAPKVGRSHTA